MKNKIINLKVPLIDLDGKEVEREVTLGKILANQLVSSTEGDPLKFFDWAMRFNKGETVELDRSDYEKLKDFVTKSKTLTNLSKGQILPLLENDKQE
jgi:cell division septal protein FtsQ